MFSCDFFCGPEATEAGGAYPRQGARGRQQGVSRSRCVGKPPPTCWPARRRGCCCSGRVRGAERAAGAPAERGEGCRLVVGWRGLHERERVAWCEREAETHRLLSSGNHFCASFSALRSACNNRGQATETPPGGQSPVAAWSRHPSAALAGTSGRRRAWCCKRRAAFCSAAGWFLPSGSRGLQVWGKGEARGRAAAFGRGEGEH